MFGGAKPAWAIMTWLACSCAGCASYQYNLVQPPSAAELVTANLDKQFEIDSLEYHLQADENRLVMRVFNRSGEPVALAGRKSEVIDPQGLAHPLHDEVIAPGGFAREIFPPFKSPRPQPNFGLTLAVGSGGADESGNALPRGYNDPSRIDNQPDAAAYDWDWTGESAIHLRLVYRTAAKTFEHRFVIQRIAK
jgi:hypothetical protein